ncbi:MAG: hypothetical protein HYY06_03115 [Deltaproteobacteria bacterium]|nr:hypothetical protein [Deltaproteobacteria bacterium]
MKLRTSLAAACALVPFLEGAHASACSAPMEVKHRVLFARDGSLLALADPDGRVVRAAAAGAPAELAAAGRARHQLADFAADGSMLVTIEERGDDGGGCELTSIQLVAVDLATGARRPAGRAWDMIGVHDVRVSPSKTRAVVLGSSIDDAAARVFELGSHRPIRRLPAVDALWLDDDRLAVLRASGNLHLVPVSGRGLVQVGPVPAEGVERHLVEGGASPGSFRFVERTPAGWKLFRVALAEGAPPALTEESWTRAEQPIVASADGRIVAATDDARGRILVVEPSTGRLVADVRGQHRYTAIALSPDGRRLGLASHERPTSEQDGDAWGDASAFVPTTIEIVDLASASVVSWGARARSRLERAAGPARATAPR